MFVAHRVPRILVGLIALSLGLAIACGDSGSGVVLCGTQTCGSHQKCDATAKTCVCGDPYQAPACDQCADGYVASGKDCVAKPIRCEEKPCKHGSCVKGGGNPDHCVCTKEAAGPTCAQCSDSYQDNDANGTCELRCSAKALTCALGLVCRDDVGAPACGCPIGMAGEGCAQCAAGYYRFGDAACVPSCEAVKSCGLHAHCNDPDDPKGASCVCDVGYKDPGCTACADGFTKEGDVCVTTLPKGDELLATSVVDGKDALVAVDPNGTIRPLRTLQTDTKFERVLNLTTDPASKRIFVTTSEIESPSAYTGRIWEADAKSGVLSQIMASGAASPAAYVPSLGAFIGGPFLEIFKTDLGGLQMKLGMSGLENGAGTGNVGFAWDDARLRAFGSDHLNTEFHVYDVDLGTGVFANPVALPELAGNAQYEAFAATPSAMFAERSELLSEDERFERKCRDAARRLGYEGALTAPFSANKNAFAGPTVTVTTTLPSGPEIVAMGGYSGTSVVEIATQNADAFLCFLSFEGKLEFRLSGASHFKSAVIATYRNTISATVDPSFVPAAMPNIHTQVTVAAPGADLSHPEVIDATLSANPKVFRLYSRAEWKQRRLNRVEGDNVEPTHHYLVPIAPGGTLGPDVLLKARLDSLSRF